ncbi:MAG TPA: molybdate ABC transporter substrate-binding protein [Cyclobacteriaceae bacterium]|nr:molybdate ABC transporter substrate-binding protein [Cyclobacteriaceae bacterium]
MKNLAWILFLLATACNTPTKRLTIATAANVQFAMEELVGQFEEDTSIPCEIILGSSGQLTAQIMEGAPYDVFVSANMKYPEALYEKNLTVKAPVIYAYGVLVLWTLQDRPDLSLEMLKDSSILHIAVANPKTAPYGEAAIQAVSQLQLLNDVGNKLVYGESISQTNQFVVSGSAEIGFTAKSVVVSEEMKGKGTWVEVPDSLYHPIAQGVVVINREDNEKAQQFANFLLSEMARKILQAYGYNVNLSNE